MPQKNIAQKYCQPPCGGTGNRFADISWEQGLYINSSPNDIAVPLYSHRSCSYQRQKSNKHKYVSEEGCYTVGDISLANLRANRALLDDPDIFICNFPRFFLDLD